MTYLDFGKPTAPFSAVITCNIHAR